MTNYFLIIAVMFLWSICFPLIEWGLPYAPHLTFAAMRGFIAGFALLIVALILRRPQPRDVRTWLLLAGIGLGATTMGYYGMFHASEFISPGIATVITNTQPLMAAVLAAVVLKEYMDTTGKIGLSLGFLGIVLIALPRLTETQDYTYAIGIFYIVLSAIGISVSNVLISKVAGHVDALSAMGWQMILGSVFLILIALITEDISAVSWNTTFTLSLLGLALPGSALAYWLWFVVLEKVALNRANVFSFLVPVFGLTIGVMYFQESIGIGHAVGIGLTLLGIFMVNRSTKKHFSD